MKDSSLDFLKQFEEARKDIETWPEWMKEAAHEASAHFPRSITVICDTSNNPPESIEQGKLVVDIKVCCHKTVLERCKGCPYGS